MFVVDMFYLLSIWGYRLGLGLVGWFFSWSPVVTHETTITRRLNLGWMVMMALLIVLVICYWPNVFRGPTQTSSYGEHIQKATRKKDMSHCAGTFQPTTHIIYFNSQMVKSYHMVSTIVNVQALYLGMQTSLGVITNTILPIHPL